MALTHRIAGSKWVTGLVLVVAGWLCLPAAPVQACSHPSFVSFAFTDFAERSNKPTLVQRPMKPAAPPHNPFDPLGPCQSPQCDGKPDQPDRPLTSPSTVKVRDSWSLAGSEIVVASCPPMSGAWLQCDIPNPVRLHDPIFHPPRPHSH